MFITPLDTRQIGEQSFELLHRLTYIDDEYVITVKRTFDFDGASIPRIFWSLIGSPTTGKYTKAACLHDALYASKAFPRDKCDLIFLQAMESEGVGYFKRHLIHKAVRIGGSSAYNDSPELDKYRSLVVVKLND